MLSANFVFVIALLYVALLFGVAFVGDRRARRGELGWLKSPLVYTLSISIYCTSWTFYGAVGSAARSGLEFATIYIGPTLVFVGWWLLLRKLVRIGHVHGVTSIADMISSRYGKSAALAALVTLIAVVGTTPYIALQLKAVSTSFDVINNSGPGTLSGLPDMASDYRTGFWIAVGMAVFTIIFGTRNIDAKERHHGVVAAIALEAIVKLVALLAVGVLVVYGISDGPGAIFAEAPPDLLRAQDMFGPRWITITFLAAAAVVCLPREFQVTVVENIDEQHLRTASWLFPLYLFLITLFVLPIAIAGLRFLPAGSNPDMFVLTLPLWAGQEEIALLSFLGGFSSATSMVIVACIALSTMVSNHLIMPVALRLGWVANPASGEIRRFLLTSRRISIAVILLLGFVYFRLSGGSEELASIGLIAFAGVVQVLPCLIGGLFWRGANAAGAVAGLVAGASLWAYTLFLPSFAGGFVVTQAVIDDGPFGIALLRPQALLGLTGFDPLVHSLFWSLSVNTVLFVLLSLWREPRPLERLQSTLFVDVYKPPSEASGLIHRSATTRDLSILAQRILGANESLLLFQQAARAQGLDSDTPVADNAFITQLERKLAGSVGAASAHAMISQVITGETISLGALIEIADETQRVREYSQRLEQKSLELEATASQLSEANERLQRLDAEKDEFLSQVSHEVRTPMTSIRSFAEILLDERNLDPAQSTRFLRIIHAESVRLTRLLDSTLDLSVLERGIAPWAAETINPETILSDAIRACHGLAVGLRVRVSEGQRAQNVFVAANGDRLAQVFINLISNAIKYNVSEEPYVRVSSGLRDGHYEVLVEDNGPGIRAEERERIFSKFIRGSEHARTDAAGAGLGLAISWQIMQRFGGTLELIARLGPGACFRVTLAQAPAPEKPPGTSVSN
jgi:Na+/proline symporter/nitrogen-specific signal transduction histidine kinase